ncbi:MAG: 4Fe-4S binding protein [Methanoregula sp.]|nr:4Fe-4S binding protein [Methanoregula sp.]
MNITTKIRRILATALLSAGLAYPACAAVCPKGIGACASPGRCFLFVDADGNSLCDYTGRSGSSSTTVAGSNQPAVPPATSEAVTSATTAPVTTSSTPAPSTTLSSSADTPVSSASAVQQSTGSDISGMLPISAVLIGILLFLILTGIFYYSLRRGVMGMQVKQAGPALALSTLVALGISLMVSCTIAPEEIPGLSCALVYLGAGTLLTAYLWHAGVMSRKIILAVAAVSALTGFIFLAPIMPLEFISLVNTLSGTSGLTAAVGILCAVIVLAIVSGRAFCGQICPVGSLQELAYAVPMKKIDNHHTEFFEAVRLVVFVATVAAAIYLMDLMAYTGLFEIFSLSLSVGFLIAVGLVLASVFFYRPICRILCPFGVLFSLMAEFSLFRLRRTASCIRCKKCEKSCPAHVAGNRDSKRECYLCGRCIDACPVNDAISYRK